MNIIKRSGVEVNFDINKIIIAIKKANNEVPDVEKLTDEQIEKAADNVMQICRGMCRAASVEEIQDSVENQLMALGKFNVARKYITYRYTRALVRKANTTDEQILSLIECNNEEVKQENSNKNPTVNSVQRDYMAGEVSKDITRRLLLPKDIVDAHDQGIIHFHDADYFAQHMHNCDLVNLEDMLQNGTVISGTLLEKPHSFATACNIATQIIAQVASNQYGGQSISLTHLAPFVQISREQNKIEAVRDGRSHGRLTGGHARLLEGGRIRLLRRRDLCRVYRGIRKPVNVGQMADAQVARCGQGTEAKRRRFLFSRGCEIRLARGDSPPMQNVFPDAIEQLHGDGHAVVERARTEHPARGVIKTVKTDRCPKDCGSPHRDEDAILIPDRKDRRVSAKKRGAVQILHNS